MLAMQLVLRIQQAFGVKLALRQVFEAADRRRAWRPTVARADVRERGRQADAMTTTGRRRPPATTQRTAEPLPPPRPGGAGQPLPALPAAARARTRCTGTRTCTPGSSPATTTSRRSSGGSPPTARPPPEYFEALGVPEVGPIARLMVRQMLFMDAPAHTRLRRLAGAGVPARCRSSTLRQHIQDIADRLIDDVLARGDGRMDMLADFAEPLPAMVTTELLGVPVEDHVELKDWSVTFAEMLGNFQHNPDRLAGVLARRREPDRRTSATPSAEQRRRPARRAWSARCWRPRSTATASPTRRSSPTASSRWSAAWRPRRT